MTLEAYEAIYAQCDEWLQIVMDLLLFTTQRLGDTLMIRQDKIKNGRIPIIQEKTGSAIMVEVGPKLADVVERAKKYPVLSPYLCKRRKKKHYDKTPQPLKIGTVEEYYRAAVRGIYGDEPYPTLHEIRGLGITLVRNAERENQALSAQHLAGHKDAKQTDQYDHEIRFQEAGTL